jgi:subtilisin family serine protease
LFDKQATEFCVNRVRLSMRSARQILYACLLLSFAVILNGQTAKEIDQGYIDGQLIVKFQDWVPLQDQYHLLRQDGLRVLYRYPAMKAFSVSFDKKQPVPSMVNQLRRQKSTKWVQANFLGTRTQTTPNDPRFNQSYALDNTGQAIGGFVGFPDADMDAPEAWSLITDASEITIAVVDTGCRLNHEDLTSNIWNNDGEIQGNNIDDDGNGLIDDIVGWDFLGNDNIPNDLIGHGTTVAGCIAMTGNNGTGGTGVCWKTQLMVLKDGDIIPQMAASAAAIEYAAMNGAVVCNFSTNYGPGVFPALQNAISVAQTEGMIICVAAGNAGINIDSGVGDLPATYTNDNLIVVAATDNTDSLATFSNFGSTHVDVAAPGVDIQTTSRFNNSAYTFASGTSFSAPLVAGCVGLIRAYNPNADYQTVRSAVMSSCDPIASLNGQVASNGRVNLFAALNTVGPQVTLLPPNPDPMTFAVAPQCNDGSNISMVATTATPGPVEYRFILVSSIGAGGNSSPWMSSTSYTDTGLDSGGEYSYTVTARNALTLVETAPSAVSSAYTNTGTPGRVNLTSIKNTSVVISSVDANGNAQNASIAIRFNFLYVEPDGSLGFFPNWQPLGSWQGFKVTGLTPKSNYVIRAIGRGHSGTFTDYGPETSLSTPLLPPSAMGVVADQSGAAEQVMTMNGSAGDADRVIDLNVGDTYVLQVANPSTMSIPANFAILAWVGVPSDVYEIEVPGTFGRGTFCFTPCDLNPLLPSFNLISTFGSNCGEYATTGGQLATWTSQPQSFPFPLPELTLQVWIEETPGMFAVGNAMVLRYQ